MNSKFKRIIILGNYNSWVKHLYEKKIKTGEIIFFDWHFPIRNKRLRDFCHWWYICRKPLTRYWNILFDLNLRPHNRRDTLIIFHDWNILATDYSYIERLRKKAKLAYMFTNIQPITGACEFGYFDRLHDLFDAVFTYDSKDAEKYGFNHLYLPYEPLIENNNVEPESDILFVGKAKDRLDTLHNIYKTATDLGLRCDFNITEVDDDNKLYDDINYNQEMSYSDVIKRTLRTRCIFDPIQSNSRGYTLRVPEAVMFDKKLITTNRFIAADPCFDSRRMLIWDGSNNLKEFIDSPDICYSDAEKLKFSVDNFIEKIENTI